MVISKASGGDRFLAELFKILKDDAVNVLHSVCQQIWKTQRSPQDWERSVFIPISKKVSAKVWRIITLNIFQSILRDIYTAHSYYKTSIHVPMCTLF